MTDDPCCARCRFWTPDVWPAHPPDGFGWCTRLVANSEDPRIVTYEADPFTGFMICTAPDFGCRAFAADD